MIETDVALIGTGVAPLVAAGALLERGKRVFILNPDRDFFREDSEFPLDPLVPWSEAEGKLSGARLSRSLPEAVLEALRPRFPGAIESVTLGSQGTALPSSTPQKAFHDPRAPHLRSRSWIWMRSSVGPGHIEESKRWERVETLFVEAADAGLNPQELGGLVAMHRFPGYSEKSPASQEGRWDGARAVSIPHLSDIDVDRYRNGLLEFIRERLGSERMVCPAEQIELSDDGIRFHSDAGPGACRIQDGALIFCTPRLLRWIRMHANPRGELRARARFSHEPMGVRLWEDWSLLSREPLDSSHVGFFEDMAVWSDFEGCPEDGARLDPTVLRVLRSGPLSEAPWDHVQSAESFDALARLCHGFLQWDKFSVRGMRARLKLEWPEAPIMPIQHGRLDSALVPASDGFLSQIVANASRAAERFL